MAALAHVGTAFRTVPAGAHTATGTSHEGGSALVHVVLIPTRASLARFPFGTGTGSATLEVLTAILNVFLEEFCEFFDLL